MVSKHVTANFLLSFDFNSHSKIQDHLDPNCMDAIVVCQKHCFIEGCDVAIWEHFPGEKTTRTVIGTGPVRQTPSVDVSGLQVSEDSSIPRSVRLRQALAQMNETPIASPPAIARLLIDNVCEVDMGELDAVRENLNALQNGCENVLSTDSIAWALKLKDGSLSHITKSWDGTLSYEEYWRRMNEVLDLAGLSELPQQVPPRAE